MLAAAQPPARAAAPMLCRWGASWKSHPRLMSCSPFFSGPDPLRFWPALRCFQAIMFVSHAVVAGKVCRAQAALMCSAASPTCSSPLLNDSWQVCCWVTMFYDFISKCLVFINIVPVLICNDFIACGFCNCKQCLDCYCTFVFLRF